MEINVPRGPANILLETGYREIIQRNCSQGIKNILEKTV